MLREGLTSADIYLGRSCYIRETQFSTSKSFNLTARNVMCKLLFYRFIHRIYFLTATNLYVVQFGTYRYESVHGFKIKAEHRGRLYETWTIVIKSDLRPKVRHVFVEHCLSMLFFSFLTSENPINTSPRRIYCTWKRIIKKCLLRERHESWAMGRDLFLTRDTFWQKRIHVNISGYSRVL